MIAAGCILCGERAVLPVLSISYVDGENREPLFQFALAEYRVRFKRKIATNDKMCSSGVVSHIKRRQHANECVRSRVCVCVCGRFGFLVYRFSIRLFIHFIICATNHAERMNSLFQLKKKNLHSGMQLKTILVLHSLHFQSNSIFRTVLLIANALKSKSSRI